MPSQPEARLSRKIMEALRAKGYFCFKVWGNDHTMAGLTDIIVCARGLFIGLEVKMPDKRDNTTKIQEHRHRQIRESHGIAEVVCSAHEALEVVAQRVREVYEEDWWGDRCPPTPGAGA